jgi:hypothetical protein
MHSTSFLVLKGRIRFKSPTASFDARVGGFVEVPPGKEYGFSNPFGEVAEVMVVYSPGFYVECLRELAGLWERAGGKDVGVEEQVDVMRGWGTLVVEETGPGDEEMDELEEEESEEEEDQRGTLQCMA